MSDWQEFNERVQEQRERAAKAPKPPNVVSIKSDLDVVAMLEKFAQMARDAELSGVVVTYVNKDGKSGFRSIWLSDCNRSTLLGELGVALHVLQQYEAQRAGLL